MRVKNGEIISIVVPVYNVEAYLEKCVNSLLIQTYKDIEIVLVDDGSTDSSGRKCDKLAGQDSRINVIHKENGGLSSARNIGIQTSSGNLIGFVDSDDFVSPDMYERLYKNLKRFNVDVSCCASKYTFNHDEKPIVDKISKIALLDRYEYYKSCVSMSYGNGVGVCNKLYKKSIFNSISFKEGIFVEDYYFLPDSVLEINNAVIEDFIGYYYFQRKGGITRNFEHKAKKSIIDRIDGCKHNEKILNAYGAEFIKLVEEANLPRYLVICRIYHLSNFLNGSDKHLSSIVLDIEKKIKKSKLKIVRSKIISWKIKVRFLIWFISPVLYYRLYAMAGEKREKREKSSR